MANRRIKPGEAPSEPAPSRDDAVEALDLARGKPADELFKAMLRSRAEAVSLLASALPTLLASCIRWDTLEAVPTEQVDRWLDKRYSDLLFRVALKGEKQAAFINVLLEHQSRSERFMPLRVLGMAVRLWEAWRRDHPKAKRLPVILPVVLYPGERGRGWRHSVQLSNLLEASDETLSVFRDFIPDFRFVLDDLSHQSLDALFARQLTELALVTLRLLRDARLPGFLGSLDNPRELAVWRQVGEGPEGPLAYQQFWLYLYRTVDVPNDQIHDFARKLGQVAEEAEMTAAQRLIAQVAPKLRAEAKAEGKAEGAAAVLKRLLGLKFAVVDAAVFDRVDRATMAELESWTERILTAKDVEDVFG